MKGTSVRRRETVLLLSLCGFLGGVANGLLGAGGGIIMTFALERVLRDEPDGKRDMFANVIAATLPITCFSAILYAARGNLATDSFAVFVLPAVIGGLVGAVLLGRISTVWLKRLFALLVIWSGLCLILRT